MIKKEWQANILLLLASFIWGSAFVAQRLAAQHIGPLAFNATRFFIGALSVMPVLWFFSLRKKISQNIGRPRKEILLSEIKPAVIPGIILGVLLFFGSYLQQLALTTTTASKAGFITGLYIVFVPIVEIFFGRKLKNIMWLCIPLATAGLFLISVNGDFKIAIGDILAFIAVFFWTGHILTVDHFSKKANPLLLALFQFTITAVISLICAIIFERNDFSNITGSILPILYVGIFSAGGAFTLQIIGQKHSKASHASIIFSLESVFACVSGVCIIGETLSFREAIGCVLMVLAMFLTQFDWKVIKKANPNFE